MSARNARQVRVAALAVAGGGVVVAALAPYDAMTWFRAHVVGAPHPVTEPFVLDFAHRVVAAAGACVAGAALWWGPSTARPRPPQLAEGPWLVAAGVAFVGAVAMNLRWAGVQLGLWGWWLPWLRHAYLPLVGAFTAFGLVAMRPRRAWRELGPTGWALATCLGLAYGTFSGLWHCCAPLHVSDGIPWPLTLAGFAAWAVALGAFVPSMALRRRGVAAWVLGAVLFAVGYPWHTPWWFVQGLVGGAFVVLLTRWTGSIASPGVFIVTAYLAHTTLPFLGRA